MEKLDHNCIVYLSLLANLSACIIIVLDRYVRTYIANYYPVDMGYVRKGHREDKY